MLIDSLVVFKPRCIYVLPSDFTVIGVIVLLWLFLHIKKAHLTISDSGSSIVRTFELRSSNTTLRCSIESLKLELRFLRIWLISDTAEYLLCGLTSCAEIYSIIYWNLLDSHLNTVQQQPCVGERRKATTFQFGKYFADILVLDISKFINFIHSLTRLPKEALKTLFPPELQR